MEATMSLVDHFDNQTETEFSRGFDREAARRQLRISIVLVAAMAIAAFILGFALPVSSGRAVSPGMGSSELTGRLVSLEP
jgi:hypothetical protein